MRVVFCGNPAFAQVTLDALLDSQHEVAAVICSPDKPRGRGRKMVFLPVKSRAFEAGLPVLQPENLSDADFLSEVRRLNPDCLVVVAFRILPKALFAMPKHGSLNVHPSLLPRGRGPAPIRWTLLRGEQITGVSIIQLSEEIDGGVILRQDRTEVAPDEDYGMLHDRLAQIGARMLVETLNDLELGIQLPIVVQDESQVTRAPKLKPKDFELPWSVSGDDILRRIRAFAPEPGAVVFLGSQRLKILEADRWPGEANLAPGEIQGTGDGLLVGTTDGAIRLKRVKPEGKREMTIEEFLRGRPHIPASFGKNE